MKRSKFTMTVNVNYDLDTVDKVTFKFVQGFTSAIFEYPSSKVVRIENTDKLAISWSADDSFKFNGDEPIRMDTLIDVTNSNDNPETSIVEFMMNDTLFTKEEVNTYG